VSERKNRRREEKKEVLLQVWLPLRLAAALDDQVGRSLDRTRSDLVRRYLIEGLRADAGAVPGEVPGEVTPGGRA
jgi:hypothetical protein